MMSLESPRSRANKTNKREKKRQGEMGRGGGFHRYTRTCLRLQVPYVPTSSSRLHHLIASQSPTSHANVSNILLILSLRYFSNGTRNRFLARAYIASSHYNHLFHPRVLVVSTLSYPYVTLVLIPATNFLPNTTLHLEHTQYRIPTPRRRVVPRSRCCCWLGDPPSSSGWDVGIPPRGRRRRKSAPQVPGRPRAVPCAGAVWWRRAGFVPTLQSEATRSDPESSGDDREVWLRSRSQEVSGCPQAGRPSSSSSLL